MKKTVSFGLVSIMLLMVVLTGCSKAGNTTATDTGTAKATGESSPTPVQATTVPQETQTLSILITTDWVKDETKSLIKEFEAKENVKVDLQIVPGGDTFGQLVQTKINTGEAPDIIYWYTTKSNLKKVQAAKNFVDLSGEAWVEQVIPVVRDQVSLDGKVYEFPYSGSSTSGLFYNKKILSDLGIQPPKTYAEFLAACEKIKAAGITPIYDAGKDGWPLQIFSGIAWASLVGPTLPADFGAKASSNQVDYTTIAPFVDLFERQVNLIDKGYYNKDLLSGTYNGQIEAFGTGKAAFVIQGDWIAAEFNTKYPDTKYGVLPFPSDSGENYVSVGPPNGVGIWSGSKKVELAKKYFAFLAEKASLKTWYDKNGGIPSLSGVEVASAPGFEEIVATANAGKVGTFLSGSELGFSDYVRILQELISKQKTPVEAVKQFQEMELKEGKNQGLPGF